jgi:formiminotetrahydrofolate cyclodeaminase
LSGALRASVLATVARAPKTGIRPEQRAQLLAVEGTLRALAARLLALADQDRDAYVALLAAYRLPTGTPQEQRNRRAAVQGAMMSATQTPLQILAACGEVFNVAVSAATQAPVRAGGEIAVGVELVGAAFHGAVVCIAANLPAIVDGDFVESVARDQRQIETAAADDRETIRLVLAGPHLPAA